jgi:hypothetical protein
MLAASDAPAPPAVPPGGAAWRRSNHLRPKEHISGTLVVASGFRPGPANGVAGDCSGRGRRPAARPHRPQGGQVMSHGGAPRP